MSTFDLEPLPGPSRRELDAQEVGRLKEKKRQEKARQALIEAIDRTTDVLVGAGRDNESSVLYQVQRHLQGEISVDELPGAIWRTLR